MSTKKNICEIDLSSPNKLNESWLAMFGSAVQTILQSIFSNDFDSNLIKIKGTQAQISSFSRTLGREIRYLKAFQEYGLDDPRTYRDQVKLNVAINRFERDTGLRWPFK